VDVCAGAPAGTRASPRWRDAATSAVRQGWESVVSPDTRRDVGPILVLTVVSFVGTAAAPLLVANPLVLVALSPRMVFLLLAADRSPAWVFVLVATVRMCLADPFHYRLGRRQGPLVLERVHRFGRRLPSPIGRLVHRCVAAGDGHLALAAVAVRPVGRHVMWAGARAVCPRRVAAADVTSTVALCSMLAAGMSLAPW
jgi:hypothetical protein